MRFAALLAALFLTAAPCAAAQRSIAPPPALPPSIVPSQTPPLAPLSGLARAGYAVIPAAGLMDAGVRTRWLAVAAAREEGHWTWRKGHDLLPAYAHGGWQEKALPGGEAAEGLKAFVDRLTAGLEASLPGEKFILTSVEVRAGYRERIDSGVHYDGTYLTATYALRGRGTPFYPVDGGGVRRADPLEDSVAVLSGETRALETGGLPVLHNDPDELDPDRVLVIVRYETVGGRERREALLRKFPSRLEDFERAWKKKIFDELGPAGVANGASAVVK